MEERNYNLRKLTAKDLFPLSTILSKIGVRQLKEVFNNNSFAEQFSNDKADKNLLGLNIGVEIAGLILQNLEHCEQNIYKFLASVSGMKEQEIANLEPALFLEMIIEVVKKDEFKDFFKAASRLVK